MSCNCTNHFFTCRCEHPYDHMIVKVWDFREEGKKYINPDDEYFVSLYVAKRQFRSFFCRLWAAVKYVFGFDELDYGEVMPSREELEKFTDLLMECCNVYSDADREKALADGY